MEHLAQLHEAYTDSLIGRITDAWVADDIEVAHALAIVLFTFARINKAE